MGSGSPVVLEDRDKGPFRGIGVLLRTRDLRDGVRLSTDPDCAESRDKGMGSALHPPPPGPPQISAFAPPAQPSMPTPGTSPVNSHSQQTRKSRLSIPSIPSLHHITRDELVISRPLPSGPSATLRSIRDTQVLMTHGIWGGDLDTAAIFSGEVQAGTTLPGMILGK